MGDALTRVTIWLALALYAAAQMRRRIPPTATSTRGLWPLAAGCALYLAHVVLAFDVHYGWSQATAYAETAAQTEAVIGWRWGGGIYVNYVFGLAWIVEACWWGWARVSYEGRDRWLELVVRGFFLVMIVNGAVVFVEGPQRWLGVVIVAVLLVAWRPTRR